MILGRRGDLPDVHKFQAERAHPVQQGVEVGLVQVVIEDRRGGLHFEGHVSECLTSRRAKRSKDPDFVAASGHGPPSGQAAPNATYVD
jgi:hypothetical protein